MARRRKRKHLRDYEPLSFTERMQEAKDLKAMRGPRARRRGSRAEKPTAAEERRMLDAELDQYIKANPDSPCVKGKPASGGCTYTGCCSWHKGVKKALAAPF